MTRTRVVDIVDARAPHVREGLRGQQAETQMLAEHANQFVTGCQFAVMLTFVRKPDGGWNVEAGCAGVGPRGMGKLVADSLHAAASVIGDAMTAQEPA